MTNWGRNSEPDQVEILKRKIRELQDKLAKLSGRVDRRSAISSAAVQAVRDGAASDFDLMRACDCSIGWLRGSLETLPPKRRMAVERLRNRRRGYPRRSELSGRFLRHDVYAEYYGTCISYEVSA